MNNQFIILQGIPASGKSTWARKWVEENPTKRIIVNRDSIRRSLGPYWVPQRENLVSSIERAYVEEAVNAGYDICLDATNLNPKFLSQWIDYIQEFSHYEVVYIKFKISLEEALERDKNREFSVGEDIVKKFYNNYNYLL